MVHIFSEKFVKMKDQKQKPPEKPRSYVLKAYLESHERFGRLYAKLAKT